jgi:hypothetical protein
MTFRCALYVFHHQLKTLRMRIEPVLATAEVERLTAPLHYRGYGRANGRRLDSAIAIELNARRIVIWV